MIYSLKRWLNSFKSIVSDFVTGVGLFWLFVEMASYSTDGATDQYTKSILVFILVALTILLISLYRNKTKTSFKYKLRDKDNFIEIKVGDAFENDGAVVIPFNDCLDVSLGGNVKKAKSLQNKLIADFYAGKDEHLATDIGEKVDYLAAPYDIGTVVEIEQQGKTFYLLVNSRKKNNNRVESSADDFLLSLSRLWEFIALESGRNAVVSIPLISTNHGRITNINRATAVKEIIDSYVDASKTLNVADNLIICIHPSDLEKGNIKLDDLDDFLRFSCQHYKVVKFSEKPEGNEDTSSVVESISR